MIRQRVRKWRSTKSAEEVARGIWAPGSGSRVIGRLDDTERDVLSVVRLLCMGRLHGATSKRISIIISSQRQPNFLSSSFAITGRTREHPNNLYAKRALLEEQGLKCSVFLSSFYKSRKIGYLRKVHHGGSQFLYRISSNGLRQCAAKT